jgi:outer membrane protein OmpA-like peptidoglycan-associated protein
MKIQLVLTVLGLSSVLAPNRAFSASDAQAASASAVPAPFYKVTVVQASAQAINYRDSWWSTKIDFKGTALLAGADGSAKINSRSGSTSIDATFEGLPVATQFGPEFLTYVLWAISPEGRSTNLGELIVKNGRSELEATEPLQAFALVVTAEPYFAVSLPSNAVVLENAIRKSTKGRLETIDAKYELLEKGQYQVNIAAADLGMVMDEHVPLEVYEARNAVRIAKAAGAETYAADMLGRAEQLLAQSESKKGSRDERLSEAREAVERAEEARSASVKSSKDAALAAERQRSQDRLAAADGAAATAALRQAHAETATAQAQLAQGQADAGRTAAETAGAAANKAADSANAGRTAAEAAAATSAAAAGVANSERDAAVGRAKSAEKDKAALRAQLLQQFGAILETRDTARGLIVNMSGVLFAMGKSDLRPAAREKLAKISGILLAHPDLKLSVEGYTDSTGSAAFNQTLSEQRAEGARDYLVSQGVAADSIVSAGYGSAQPVASNDTASGRRSNRRVELVVNGDSIKAAPNSPVTP